MNNIFVLYGQDRKRIIGKRREIINDYNIDDFNISIFDMDFHTIEEAMNDAFSIPFLSERRAVVITNATFLGSTRKKKDEDEAEDADESKAPKSKANLKPLESFIENPVLTTVLIVEVPLESLDSKKKFNKLIMEKHRDYRISYPDKAEIAKLTDEFLRSEKLSIKTDAKNELLRRIQDCPLDYDNELEKLAIYVGEEGTITKEIVTNLITDSDNSTIFDLMKAIMKSDREKSLSTYYSLIDNGSDPMMILGFITKRFEQILYVKEMVMKGYRKEDVSNALGVSSGQAYFLMEDARVTDYRKLSKVLKDLRELDHGVKVDFRYGKDDATGFELFLLKRQ